MSPGRWCRLKPKGYVFVLEKTIISREYKSKDSNKTTHMRMHTVLYSLRNPTPRPHTLRCSLHAVVLTTTHTHKILDGISPRENTIHARRQRAAESANYHEKNNPDGFDDTHAHGACGSPGLQGEDRLGTREVKPHGTRRATRQADDGVRHPPREHNESVVRRWRRLRRRLWPRRRWRL